MVKNQAGASVQREGPYAIDDQRFHRMFVDEGKYDLSKKNGLSHSAVWRCVSFACDKVAGTPIYPRQRDEDGGSSIDREHRAYRVLRRKASNIMTASNWKRTMMLHALYYAGNAFSYIKPIPGTQFGELILMDPRRVSMYVLFDPVKTANGMLESGTVIYEYTLNGVKYHLAQSDVFHVVGLSFNGVWGLHAYDYMKMAIGAGNVARDYGFRYFEKGGHPSFIVYYPKRLEKDKEERWVQSIKEATEGLGNSHTTFPVYNDAKIEALSHEPDKQQALEGRKYSDQQVCNFFGFHPSVVGLEGSESYNSLEVASEMILDSIDPWFERFEDEAFDKLLTPQQQANETHFFEFAREEIKRVDFKTKVKVALDELNNGGLNHDQYSRIMKRPTSGHENGSRYRMPSNITYMDAEPVTQPPLPSDADDGAARNRVVNAIYDSCRRAAHRITKKIERNYDDRSTKEHLDSVGAEVAQFLSIVSPVIELVDGDVDILTGWVEKLIENSRDLKNEVEAVRYTTQQLERLRDTVAEYTSSKQESAA